MKITDFDFKLKRVHAVSFKKLLSNGATSPLLIAGMDESTAIIDKFVIKILHQHFSEGNAICELVGAFIAMELDLFIPEPVLVNINQAFQKSLMGRECFELVQQSSRLAVGSRHINGFQDWYPQCLIPELLYEQAFEVFVFDLFILNADRTFHKVNLMTDGSIIMLIDHEKALVPPLFGSTTPWKASQDKVAVTISLNHLFTKALDRKKWEYASMIDHFTEKLVRINPDFWRRAENEIPQVWLENPFGRSVFEGLKARIVSIVENLDEYKKEIKLIMP